ncbi:hypothetical protein FJZ31_34115 [Candidatus Poribacteria bacterium]|nr:hypothetical protein [Candidatus Poribacteria bacterium]
MPQRDVFHDVVKIALIKDEWTITHAPFILPFGVHNLYIDLGAERAIIAAEKTGRKIAVEIKDHPRNLSPNTLSLSLLTVISKLKQLSMKHMNITK